MVARNLFVSALLGLFVSGVHGGVGEWKNYTDMKGITGVVAGKNELWASTRGGLFRFRLSDSSFTTFTNSEGLATNALSAVFLDATGKVWVGAGNGAVDIYDPATRTWQHIQDFLLSEKTQKGVTGFYQLGDSLYIASDFGVSLFLQSRFEFRETYSKFGSFPSSIRVNSFLIDGSRLWVATPSGAASADKNNPNLSAPSAWTTYTADDGLPVQVVNALAVFNGTVYAGTDAGLAKLNQSSWEAVGPLLGKQITRLVPIGSRLYVGAASEVYSLSTDGAVSLVGTPLPSNVTALASDPSGNLVVGVDRNGLAFPRGTTWSFKFPNGPASNLFIGLKVDSAGVLWAGSGINGRGTGFYRLDPSAPEGKQWTNYDSKSNPELRFDDYYKVSLTRDNAKWVSSWGRGVARVDKTGRLTLFNQTNSCFVGLPEGPGGDPTFIVIGDVASDVRGNTWMTVRSASDGNVLAVYRPDSTWFCLGNGLNPTVTLLTGLAIDLFDTKWIVSEEPSFRGLIYMTDGGTLTTLTDDSWNILTAADGLSSNNITRVVADREGQVWVGSDLGLNIIINPRSPKGNIRRVFVAREQYVNDIAIDPLGNKWVGTKEGVFVLSSDGTVLLAQYTAANTNGKLIDDDVRAVAFDDKRGIAYFGTENGLSSLGTTSVAPVESFGDLTVFPNPFRLPSTGPLQIDGLVRDSNIKILTIDGRLVREFPAPGGRIAFWDGRDDGGELVSTGVYVIVASSETGGDVATGKVAVLKK
jgi:ligand-binding sensor domain-containing protein